MSKGSAIKKFFGIAFLVMLIPAAFGGWWFWKIYFKPGTSVHGEEQGVLYVHTGTTYEQLVDDLEARHLIESRKDFEWTAKLKKFKEPKPGRYKIRDGMTYRELVNMFMAGLQEPVNVSFNSMRTKEDLAGRIGRKLECDSIELITLLNDDSFCGKYGFNTTTIMTLFIPDTYEMYWNTSAEDFFKRMAEEYKKFWNDDRRAKAKALNMTQSEVSILASIVEAEQLGVVSERKTIAGLYLNRIRKGIPLQSDPTVIYAIGDFSINRVLNSDLDIDSPYNTYKRTGLPPGPIRIPEKASIDAVLDYERSNYIYMCAEYGTGKHKFTADYDQHLKNAREYQRALDKASIKR